MDGINGMDGMDKMDGMETLVKCNSIQRNYGWIAIYQFVIVIKIIAG